MSGQPRKPAGSPNGTGGQYDFGHADAADDLIPLAGDRMPERGRIVTLLEDRLPLDPERTLKVPVMDPKDDLVAGRRKLGRYLYDSLDRGADRERLAFDTADALWPGLQPVSADDEEVNRDLKRIREKTGSPAVAYRNGDRILIIGVGPHKPMLGQIGYRYRRSDRIVDTTSLPSLLAAREIVDRMPTLSDPRRASLDMLDDNRRSYEYSRANMGVSDVLDLVRQARERGVVLPGAPDSDDPRGMLAWADEAGSVLDRSGDPKAADAFRTRVGWVSDGANARLAVMDVLRVESDARANRDRDRRIMGGESATVFMDKKRRDQAHERAGSASRFAADFDRVEIDDDVDLALFDRLDGEWTRLKRFVPSMRERAVLRFRYTGRHHATGVYHPALRNIAVDPRHPASFSHELLHHWDHTGGSHDLSLDPGFRPILDRYRERVDRGMMRGSDPMRWLAPAEVFARAGETWLSRRGADGSSLLESSDVYESDWAYAPFRGMEREIDALFDRLSQG